VQNLDDGRVKVVSGGETDQRLDVAAELLTKLIIVNEKILNEIKATRKELTETHCERIMCLAFVNGWPFFAPIKASREIQPGPVSREGAKSRSKNELWAAGRCFR
jgi:hypothetical protein